MENDVKRQVEEELKRRDLDFANLSGIKKCPRCGGRLDEGYITIRLAWWNESRPDWWWKFPPRDKPLTTWRWWRRPVFPALRCRPCHFVTFDYASEVERGTVKE
jgi:hypothetical protein